ncbi:cation diffusion facilitator family transporter [Corynebacterium guangdongense]|uniref:Cobalt-zinc-cadmium efflux system protein n=1 Tax=Corynebacterium guangdongense TaxID=1783348 RepID=A0ABU1ZW76_9CORY|nr:cation diffusion facilitator family transporter [Corynebacterium guangdongense]MDR7329182.1 cobalt-zinc-cadmium efflux system protein [Corynebacterium guangdongense]WJZ17748.1 Cadmium, cobalt and zinc/H(+)-K(+) antiporter [Corynebacterium guangdongense]
MAQTHGHGPRAHPRDADQEQEHGHDHDHDHGHGHGHGFGGTHTTDAPLRALIVALLITGTVFLAELVAGLVSGSLALLSDAMHMLSDSTGLILALVAMLLGRREVTSRSTYGHRRVEVVAAMINAVVVTGVVAWILIEALGRFTGPRDIDAPLMIAVAILGLAANALSAAVLVRHRDASLNMRGAFLHVLADMLASVAVIVAGVVIVLTGWTAADTIASLAIVALVAPRSIRLLLESLSVLLNRVPEGIDPAEVARRMREIPGVTDVHDLHIWSTEGVTSLATCHLVVDPDREEGCHVLDAAQARLRELGIEHSTIQLELPEHRSHEDICVPPA